MPLNQNFQFIQLPLKAREAFRQHREPKRILLVTGHALYKFTPHPLVDLRNGSITPWWFLEVPEEPADPGLAGLQQRSQALQRPPSVVTRARAAVPNEGGNPMTKMLKAKLIQPVYGWYGQCSHQPYDQYAESSQQKLKAKVVYIGGAWQVYIPYLTRLDIRQD